MLFDSTIPPVADPVIPRTDAPSKKFHCPVWTDERIEIVRARYPVENTEELAKELGVTVNSLQMACIRNNIKKDEDYIKNSNKRKWTEKEDAMIEKWWPIIIRREMAGKTSCWLAKEMLVARSSLINRAKELGLTHLRKKEPDWSEEELKILEDNFDLTKYEIKRKLKKRGYHRTESAIKTRIAKLYPGGIRESVTAYSANRLSKCMGVSVEVVIKWIRKEWLKATPRGGLIDDHGSPKDRWIIRPKHIREFLIDNAALINPRSIDFIWLMDLMRGD